MSRGFLVFVQDNGDVDYLKLATACAMSIKKFMPQEQVCLVTDIFVPDNFKKYFDIVKDIPGEDLAKNSKWKVQNRCKIYDASPFDETIVLDADMLVLEDITHWWKALSNYELYYTDKVKTFRNEIVQDNFYRKVFEANDLPNVYCGMYYFKRTENNHKFFNLLKDIVENYNWYSEKYTAKHTQSWCSMDVSTAIAIKIKDISHQVFSKKNFLTFTHMKPNIQNWLAQKDSWLEVIDYNLNNSNELMVGNFLQKGIFHYVEKSFITDKMMEQLQ